MAKVSSLIEVLRLGGNHELVYQQWAQFTLSAVRVNVDLRGHVTRSWLVLTFAPCFLRSLCASNLFPVLVPQPECDVSMDFVSLHQLGKVARDL